MKPAVCLKCKLYYKIKKNGVYLTEMMPYTNGEWRPYKIWQGDLWECRGCGHEIVMGWGKRALREHFEEHFEDLRIRTHANEIEIKDC